MFFDMHEQRRFMRFDVNFDIQLFYAIELADGRVEQREFNAVIKDISDVGFRIVTAFCEDFDCGMHLDVVFFNKDENPAREPVRVEATIVWLERDPLDDSIMSIGAYLNEPIDMDMNIMSEIGACAPMVAI